MSLFEMMGDFSLFNDISKDQKKVFANENVLVIKMDDAYFAKLDSTIQDKINKYLIELLADRLGSMNKALSKIAQYAQRNIGH